MLRLELGFVANGDKRILRLGCDFLSFGQRLPHQGFLSPPVFAMRDYNTLLIMDDTLFHGSGDMGAGCRYDHPASLSRHT